jgi:deazaflavin-dependent oxidoreductase (nitroreductase family)
MTAPTATAARAPRHVSLLNPVLMPLLRAGLPVGFNGLITIRGRTSGAPRTTGIAIIERAGRRWIWSPWGDVHWVLNLRAAGEADITVRRRTERVRALELDPAERVAFFRDVLVPVADAMPFGRQFIRLVDGVDLSDPARAAEGRVAFELLPVETPR